MDPLLYVSGILLIVVGFVLVFLSARSTQGSSKGVAIFLVGPFPVVIGSRRLLFLLAPLILIFLIITLAVF